MKIIYQRLFAVIALALFAGASSFAQTPACPTVSVSCPDRVAAGQPLVFTVNVSGGDPNVTPTFNWTVSAGTISSGQGTSSITVDTAGTGGQTITATVDVGGYDRACSTSNSCTTSVFKAVDSRKYGEYVISTPAAEKTFLDKLFAALKADSGLTAYIIGYGGRTSQPDVAQKIADAAGNYLYDTHKLESGRALTGAGGYREQPTVEIYLAAPDAVPPLARPTVRPEDVKPAAKPKPPAKPAKKTGRKS